MSMTVPTRIHCLSDLVRSQATVALLVLAGLSGLHAPTVRAMGLTVAPHAQACPSTGRAHAPLQPVPAQAAARIPDSQLASGHKDMAWVWLASPTRRYPHRALGSPVHAGSVHALVRARSGSWAVVERVLPLNRVYEDRVPRIVDLDQDGSEEIVLIEADMLQGASLVVLGVDQELVPFASAMDVSNHRMGALEQELAVIVHVAGKRPAIIVPDMSRRALHALRWDEPGRWTELSDTHPLPGLVERLTPLPGGACATLADGSALRLTLSD